MDREERHYERVESSLYDLVKELTDINVRYAQNTSQQTPQVASPNMGMHLAPPANQYLKTPPSPAQNVTNVSQLPSTTISASNAEKESKPDRVFHTADIWLVAFETLRDLCLYAEDEKLRGESAKALISVFSGWGPGDQPWIPSSDEINEAVQLCRPDIAEQRLHQMAASLLTVLECCPECNKAGKAMEGDYLCVNCRLIERQKGDSN